MTNFKKGLSFSVFAVLAVAFCLLIGQAFAADLPSRAQLQQERDSGKFATVSARPGAVSSTQSAVDPDAPAALNPDEVVIDRQPYTAPEKLGRYADQGTVNPRSGGDDISTATVIPSLPYADDGTTTGAAYDYDGSCGSYDGAPDVVYAYTPAADIDVTIDLYGSDYDTKVFVFENTSATEVACNDDFYADYTSKIGFLSLTAGNTYYIVIGGYSPGDYGDYHLEVTEYVDPLVCLAGETLEGEPCGTQTNLWGSDLPIASGQTYCGTSFANGTARDMDYYVYTVPAGGQIVTFESICDPGFPGYLLIWNDAGDGYYGPYYYGDDAADYIGIELYLPAGTWHPNIRGAANTPGFDCGTNPLPLSGGDWRYKLTMYARGVVAFDDCEDATVVNEGTGIPWDLAGTTAGISSVGFGKNGWFEYQALETGIAHVEVTNNDGYAFYWGVASAPACPETSADFNADGLNYNADQYNPDVMLSIQFPVLAGITTKYIEIGDLGLPWAPYGTMDIYVSPLPALTNDICLSAATDLGTGNTGDVFFHNVGATWTAVPGDYWDQDQLGCDIWFTWTASATGPVHFSTCQSDPGFDGRAELYEGAACLDTDPRQPIAGDDDYCTFPSGGGMPAFWFDATAGQTYLLRMGGWYLDPDYLPPGQGVGYLSFTEEAATNPTNDYCYEAVPFVLSDGVEVTEYGSQTNMTGADCSLIPFATWHAFTPDTCMDLEVNYDGTPEEFYYLITDYMVDACPCYDGTIVEGVQQYYPDPLISGNYSHRALYYDLLPKTYYYPAITGCQDYEADSYQINFIGTGIECSYCGASANPDVCDFGYEYINDVSVGTFANLDNGCAGYQDFTALGPVGLYRSVPALMTVVTANPWYADTLGVWVDWNQNYDLMMPEDRVATTSDGNGGEGPWYATLTPPADAMLPGEGPSGMTLMRIRLNDGGQDSPVACGINVYGEVEDYTVAVLDWVCGDADGNGTFDGADVTFLVDMYFSGGPVPVPWQAGDANADGFVNIADIVYLAEALNGGAAPVCIM